MVAWFVNSFAGTARPALTDQNDHAADLQAERRTVFWPMALASLLLFAPPAIRFFLGTSSNTAGLVLVCLLLWVVAFATGGFGRGSSARAGLIGGLGCAVILIMHLGIAVFLPRVPQEVDLARTAGSLIAFSVVAGTAGIVSDWLADATRDQIDRISQMLRFALVAIGIWCFIGYQPPSPLTLARPAFPFTEPSHYALVTAIFAIDGCVRARLVARLAWLTTWLVIGVLNQSLSLIVAVAIAGVVSLPIFYAVACGAVAVVVAAGMDLQYYLDRLDFSTSSNNLSSLVYRQGWELLQQGLIYSHAWGIGFQQLGFAPLNVPTSDVIYRILGDDNNLRDGSFLVAKMVAELGFVGIALAALFLVALVRAALFLRALLSVSSDNQPADMRIAAATICAFTVEMFVRGIGYFSSTVVLAIAAFMLIRSRRRRAIAN